MHRRLITIILFLSFLFSAGLITYAQNENNPMPLKRVTLYKHGVGYFERQGKVNGGQQITFLFDAAQMNDVLKSLVVLDLNEEKRLLQRYIGKTGLPGFFSTPVILFTWLFLLAQSVCG